eukprot:351591-Chlamydomonas_euryale.AAC.5
MAAALRPAMPLEPPSCLTRITSVMRHSGTSVMLLSGISVLVCGSAQLLVCTLCIPVACAVVARACRYAPPAPPHGLKICPTGASTWPCFCLHKRKPPAADQRSSAQLPICLCWLARQRSSARLRGSTEPLICTAAMLNRAAAALSHLSAQRYSPAALTAGLRGSTQLLVCVVASAAGLLCGIQLPVIPPVPPAPVLSARVPQAPGQHPGANEHVAAYVLAVDIHALCKLHSDWSNTCPVQWQHCTPSAQQHSTACLRGGTQLPTRGRTQLLVCAAALSCQRAVALNCWSAQRRPQWQG